MEEIRSKQRFAHRNTFYNEVVYAVVGPEKKRYGIHKGLLCHYSAFFTSAFTTDFIEASCNEIHLEEETVKDFDLFNGWLYTGTLCGPDQTAKDLSWETLVGLYFMADRLELMVLMNLVIDFLISKFLGVGSGGSIIPLPMVSEIYLKTTNSSGLRKVLVDGYIHTEKLSSIFETAKAGWAHPDGVESVHPEFLCDVSLAYLLLKPDPNTTDFGKRSYAKRCYASTPAPQSS